MTKTQINKILTDGGYSTTTKEPFPITNMFFILDSAETIYPNEGARYLFDDTNEIITVYRGSVVQKVKNGASAKAFVTTAEYHIDYSKIIGINVLTSKTFFN